MIEKKPLSFIIAVNSDKVFEENILASPIFKGINSHEIIVKKGYPSASLAYNEGLRIASNDIVVFLHQDVYLPFDWDTRLIKIIKNIEFAGISWGVLGCYGVDKKGKKIGHVYSNGLKRELGRKQKPKEVISLDELLLIIRKSNGIIFDPKFPYFHLYGTDICLQAKTMGLESYAISNFCIHNSLPIKRLPVDYWKCIKYLRSKWRNELPINTCVVKLEKYDIYMWLKHILLRFKSMKNRSTLIKNQRMSLEQLIQF